MRRNQLQLLLVFLHVTHTTLFRSPSFMSRGFSSVAWNKTGVVPVVVRSTPNVPPLHAVLSPSAALCWSFIN